MPLYYFHLYDDMVVRDDNGLELADAEAAKREATRNARALACEQVLKGHLKLHHRIEVEDEDGAAVATVTFGEAVAVEG